MNNLNDPSDQKVWPDKQGGGDDKKKYFTLPVLLLIAAYRWVWERDTRRRIQEVESRYEEEMKIIFKKRVEEQRELNQLKAAQFLNGVKAKLIERQHIYCSPFTPASQRLKIEKKLLDMVAKEPLAKRLNMETDLKNIFEKERQCASWWNNDRGRNGSMMWYYLGHWKQQISLQQHNNSNATPMKPQPDFK